MLIRARPQVMKHNMAQRLAHRLLLVAASLSFYAVPASSVILHPDHEPDLAAWVGRPDANIVGRWSSNATFVVIAPNWIVTTRHQNTFPSNVIVSGVSYLCHYKGEWRGGPSGDADIQLVRLTGPAGENADLVHYAGPYSGTDEPNRQTVVGGYGDGRGAVLLTEGIPYGYDWQASTNTILRFGTNRIEGTEDDSSAAGYISDIVIADFDGSDEGQSTIYECTLAGHDSGGGWFIHDGQQWKLAGVSRAVNVHFEEGHIGDPEYILYEAWFRNRENPYILQPDYLDAVRISSYASWILETITVEADLTGEDWVDGDDFSVLARHWSREDCNADNNWCEGADFEPRDGRVDWHDLLFLLDRWLTGWHY